MRSFAQKQNEPQKRVSSGLAWSKTETPLAGNHREHPILRLQPAIGNQVVQRMLQTSGGEREAELTATASHRFGHDFSRIRVFAKTSTTHRANRTRNTSVDFHAQRSSQTSDQKLSVSAFEESLDGVHIEAVASGIDMPDPWVSPDGFRWVQTIATNVPKPPKGPESVDGDGSTPFYYSYNPGEKDPRTFEDYSHRPVPSGSGTVVWNATLTLVGVDTSKMSLTAYDIRTYGFRLRLRSGTTGVGQVDLVGPKQDWAALGKHRAVVTAAFPGWSFSLLKGR